MEHERKGRGRGRVVKEKARIGSSSSPGKNIQLCPILNLALKGEGEGGGLAKC
jgi:hypothetical protein